VQDNALATQAEAAEVSWSNTLLGAGALACCLPALFGCLGTFLPELLHSGTSWPLETSRDRFVVNVYTWSVVLAIMSPPATLVGLVLGIIAIKRAGRRTAFGKTLIGVLVASVLLSVAFAGHMIWAAKHAKWPQPRLTEGAPSCPTSGWS
jgi:hypothetical protein